MFNRNSGGVIMTTMAAPRKTVSIYDYPEHLNPFREEDNHNKIRFWTIGRKLSRSNSITFKDLKNSWLGHDGYKRITCHIVKGRKDLTNRTSAYPSFGNSVIAIFYEERKKNKSDDKTNNQLNGDSSPVVYRRALQYSSGARSTVSSPERANRYVYGGSVTPLPRSRFQERLRSPSQHEVNSISTTPRMARSDITGSRLSVESTNPFDEGPVPPVRASRRKKKRAPLPPASTAVPADVTVSNGQTELRITETEDHKEYSKNEDEEIEDASFSIELKIIEDEDDKNKGLEASPVKLQDSSPEENETNIAYTNSNDENDKKDETQRVDDTKDQIIDAYDEETTKVKSADSDDDILNKASFPKIDINKYRRNSSVNDDDIRLRRGNLEDFHALSNKRSKSLTNTLDGSYICYDINLNEEKKTDVNSNEKPQKLVCKIYDDPRQKSIDNTSTENDFMEIDKATRELEREISKLNSALIEEEISLQQERPTVSDIRRKFDKPDVSSPNPIPKPRRSHYGDPNVPVNGKI